MLWCIRPGLKRGAVEGDPKHGPVQIGPTCATYQLTFGHVGPNTSSLTKNIMSLTITFALNLPSINPYTTLWLPSNDKSPSLSI